MKELLREMFKNVLGFAPYVNEINIKSDTKIATVVEINGHYYDYYKNNKRLSFRNKVISDTIEKVVETFVWNGEEKKEIEYIIKCDERLQDFIKRYQFSDEIFDASFRSDFSFVLDEKIEENNKLKKNVQKVAEKEENKDYDVCVFAGNKIKAKNYCDVLFEDVLNKNNIEFEVNDLDLGIIYAWASSSYEKEYIFDQEGKTTYAYEFVVGAGDDYQSTVYFCNKRLSKEFLIDFDYLNNSQNKIKWF